MSIFSSRDISSEQPQKEELQLAGAEWRWPLLFMLSLVMIGMHFPLGYLGALVILINRMRNDKYDFVIMFTLMIGGYNLTTQSEFTALLVHIVTLICIVGICLLKKPLVQQLLSSSSLSHSSKLTFGIFGALCLHSKNIIQ